MSYLPLSHIAEQVVSLYAPLAAGAATAFAESLEKLPENLREVRPTLLLRRAPGVGEDPGRHAGRGRRGRAASPPARGLGEDARAWPAATPSSAATRRRRSTVSRGGWCSTRCARALGLDRAHLCGTSAAPIARETLEYFLSLGIPILEVYGMSECTGPATISMPDALPHRQGRRAPSPAPRSAWRPDGEILHARAARVPGLLQGRRRHRARPSTTRAGFTPATSATLDADGFVQVTDRKKELIITSGGKNIAPQVLKRASSRSPASPTPWPWAIGATSWPRSSPSTRPGSRPRPPPGGKPRPRGRAQAARCPLFRAFVEREIERVNTTPRALRDGPSLRHSPRRALHRRRRAHAHPEAEAARGRRRSTRPRSNDSTILRLTLAAPRV